MQPVERVVFSIVDWLCVRRTGAVYFKYVCVLVADLVEHISFHLLVLRARTQLSAGEASTLQSQSSGTRFAHICVQPPLVVDSSEMGGREHVLNSVQTLNSTLNVDCIQDAITPTVTRAQYAKPRLSRYEGSDRLYYSAADLLVLRIDREFVTSAKKIANFNKFSEIKKIFRN